jgi:alpha-L-fucosidase 2
MVDLFGRTTPAGSTTVSQFLNGVLDPLAGAWMAMALWDHYAFTQDEAFLRDHAYPVLKGASEFVLDYLIKDADGHLIIVPSTSPENSYLDPASGRSVRITQQSAYHLSIARAVFDATARASEILGADAEFRRAIKEAAAALPSLQIGQDGTIREWFKDFQEREPGHRHLAHLLGLYPFAQITPERPDLWEAARRSVERRIDHGAGQTDWSGAWMISLLARLRDANAAHEQLVQLLRQSAHVNFFNDKPLFQIDAHLGGPAGLAEMLLQSHEGPIRLLPALPDAWPEGHIRGLVARGAFVVDIEWADGALSRARIRSQKGGLCRVSSSVPLQAFHSGQRISEAKALLIGVEFPTRPQQVYDLLPAR